MRRWRGVRTLVALLLVGTVEFSWSRPLTIGLLSSGQYNADFERTQQVLRLARLMTPALAPFGIEGNPLVVAKNRQQLIEQLQSGAIDLLLGRTFSVLEVKRRAGGQLLAQIQRHNEADNHVMFIVRQESPIQKLSDLSGQTLALLQQGSADGHLLPLSELKRHGLTPLLEQSDELQNTTVPLYRFSGGYKSTILWVLYRKVSAGVIPVSLFDQLAPSVRSEFRVIHTTHNLPNHLALATPQLDPALEKELQQQLLQLNTPYSAALNQEVSFAPLSEDLQWALEEIEFE